MLAAKVELKNAEKAKNFLLEKKLIDTKYKSKKEEKFIYFALTKKIKNKLFEVVDYEFTARKNRDTIRTLLKEKLSPKEIKLIPRSQEIIGDILILEIPEEIKDKGKVIAEAFLLLHSNLKVVVKKSEIHSGIFRTRGVKILAGEKRKSTVHLESGVRLKLNIEETYFSARLGHERLRIAKQIKKGEEILVMFSGSAPYPLILAKHSEAKHIVGVEINPKAHKFGLANLKLNKIKDNKIELYNGDVRMVLPTLKKTFDRILMPLPKTSEQFLDVALTKSKKGTTINLYTFLNEDDIDDEGKKLVKMCKELGYKVKIKDKIKCGQHAPHVFRVCYDLKVLNL